MQFPVFQKLNTSGEYCNPNHKFTETDFPEAKTFQEKYT